MADWKDFRLELVQAAIFTPEHSAFVSGKAVGIILAHFQDRFDGDMQVLPLPADIPPEIHRVVLASGDGRWRLSMAPARIDSLWRNTAGDLAPSFDVVVRESIEVLERYLQMTGVRVGRLALLVHRFCPVKDPAHSLIARFCNEASQRQPFNRSESFEIHNHKVYLPQREGIDYSINSWVRCQSANLVADDAPVIVVKQDVNTLASDLETRRFDAGQMQAFFRMAASESDDILRKYFPG